MNTTSIYTEYTHPPIPLSRLGPFDQFLLRSGVALIRWADRVQEQRTRRAGRTSEHSGPTYQAARRQAEQEQSTDQLRRSMLFWNIR